MNFYLYFFSLFFFTFFCFLGLFVVTYNYIRFLLIIELVFLLYSFLFIFVSSFLLDFCGILSAFYNLSIAGSDSAIGLLLIVLLFKKRNGIELGFLSLLKQ